VVESAVPPKGPLIDVAYAGPRLVSIATARKARTVGRVLFNLFNCSPP
jgi:hypothetical protein